MRICVVSTSIFPVGKDGVGRLVGCSGYSGLEVIAWQCAKGLAELGHQVSLVAPEGSECPNVQIVPIPAKIGEEQAYGGVKGTGWGGYWPHLLSMNDGGCVIDHSWEKRSSLLKMETGKDGKPVLRAPILAVNHAPVDTMYQKLPPPGVLQFVCISEDQKAHFEALWNRSARCCKNGVDVDFYRNAGVPRTDRFLFLARFSSIKGADIALDACRKAGVGLDLIGDTQITNEPGYIRQCMALADGKRLRIVGNQPRGGCVWWFSQAHCMLHPNLRFREPLGLAPLEAQACGTPCVAFDNGAMRETIKDGETGWVVKTQDEFDERVKTVASLGIPDQMRRRCREWVCDSFSLSRMILRYASLAQEALEGGW